MQILNDLARFMLVVLAGLEPAFKVQETSVLSLELQNLHVCTDKDLLLYLFRRIQ